MRLLLDFAGQRRRLLERVGLAQVKVPNDLAARFLIGGDGQPRRTHPGGNGKRMPYRASNALATAAIGVGVHLTPDATQWRAPGTTAPPAAADFVEVPEQPPTSIL